MIYLASPFTGTFAEQKWRYQAVAEYTTQLLRAGHCVFSPIVYTHQIHHDFDLPTEYEFWLPLNIGMLRRASQMIVFQLDGWDKSRGVAAEIALAEQLQIPITMTRPKIKDDFE